MTPIVDCHTHTGFSDGEASFEENVRAAAAAGCRALVSTDHLTLPASMDPAGEVQVLASELGRHRAEFEAARALAAELAPALEVIYGFECDWYPGCEPVVERWSEGARVLLGSVHWLGDPGDVGAGVTGEPGTEGVAAAGLAGSGAGWIDDPGDLHVWDELGADEVWRLYADTWCRACESPLGFDVMAHPDLAARFSADGLVPARGLGPLWDRMARCARDTGRRVELSTAALRKGVGDYYPSWGLLERFAAAGVPLALGSDAHRACDVCWGIERACRHAWDCGYRSVDVPHADGSWQTVPL